MATVARAEAMPWAGNGTEADPYIIASSVDYKNIYEYSWRQNNSGVSILEDTYFKLTSDIVCNKNGSDVPALLSAYVTIDLNGHKITSSYEEAMSLDKGGNVISSSPTPGELICSNNDSSENSAFIALSIGSGKSSTVKNVKLVSTSSKFGYGLFISGSKQADVPNVAIDNCYIEGSLDGISMSFDDGSLVPRITISNSSITGKTQNAISAYGGAQVTINSGSKINGGAFAHGGSELIITGGTFTDENCAVSVQSDSNLTISGGTFVSTGAHSGGLIQLDSSKWVNITGGTFKGATLISQWESGRTNGLSVTGGYFIWTGTEGYDRMFEQIASNCISGGTFSTKFDTSYLANGCSFVEKKDFKGNTVWVVASPENKNPSPEPQVYFADVDSTTPHSSDIGWLATSGITTGWNTSNGSKEFRGMSAVVRQDMAAFLYRLAGSPKYTVNQATLNKIVDVNTSTPHYKEICWLVDSGISTGWSAGNGKLRFDGMATVKRQDMAAFLKRLSAYKGKASGGKSAAANTFTDVTSATPHQADILWLAGSGVTTGWKESNGTSTFRGMDAVVRQDMAAFLHRMSAGGLV